MTNPARASLTAAFAAGWAEAEIARRDHLLRVCRGCGCTDQSCLPGGCAWVLLDIDSPSGVCSECAQRVAWHPAWLTYMGTELEDELPDLDEVAFALSNPGPGRDASVAIPAGRGQGSSTFHRPGASVVADGGAQ